MIGLVHTVLKVMSYTGWSKCLCAPDDYSTSSDAQRLFWSSLFNIFCAKKGPYYVLETSYIMFVKLYYWNCSCDRGQHVGQPGISRWVPVLSRTCRFCLDGTRLRTPVASRPNI